MGGKSSKVTPRRVVPSESEQGQRRHQSDLPSHQSNSLNNSQTFGDSSHSTYYGRQESGNSGSLIARNGGGGHSRPDSQRSKRPMSQMSRYSGKVGLNQGQSRGGSRGYGRSDGRLKDSFQPTRVDPFTPSDLVTSFRSNFASRATTSHHQPLPDLQPCEQSSLDNNEGTSYLMRINKSDDEPQGPVTACPTCNSKYRSIVHVPYLLLCGHTFCSSCIEQALKFDPPSLKCGHCFIKTPVEPQSRVEDFVRNEAILDLIESKEFITTIGSSQSDRCAECERNLAVKYCSECSASYCEACNKQQHTGSKVRARHKPIPISLKPKPQPTCKKHPGQSCVLYCETEHQPMCVLCKFYGEHKFHNYQLLNNSASAYRNTLSMKLTEINKMEERLSQVAQTQSNLKEDIRNKAMEAQEKLEKNFAETRKETMAALEHREATLLCLLDRQVEVQEMILEEQRLELASARSRAIAAKEEVTKLLDLNSTTAILARKHVDNALDSTLKQTSLFPDVGDDSRNSIQLIPLGLRPKQEITSKLQQVLNQHGIILQLPERLLITEAKIHSKSITIRWEVPDQSLEVTDDRTRSFSLHCFADVPLKFKREKLQNFHNRRLLNVKSNSPGLSSHDSGYQDCGSDTMSQTSNGRLPLIPPSMRSSSNQNVSILKQQQQLLPNNGTRSDSQGLLEASNPSTPVMQQVRGQAVLKPQSVKLAQSTAAARASGALLKLPALLTKTTEDDSESPSDSETDDPQCMSNASEAMSAETEDTSHLIHVAPSNAITVNNSQSNSCSSSNSNISTEPANNDGVNIGQCNKGYKFEEIYAGPTNSFTYSGIVGGATYYFRVRCCNAVGEGPWSDTFKCKIPTGVSKKT